MIIKKFIFFLVTWITIKAADGFSPKDFCILPNRDQYEIRCKRFQCGLEFCSTNEKKCKALIGWTILVEKNVSYYHKTVEYYHYFLQSINPCETNQYISIKSEVCRNDKKICYKKIQWQSRLMFKGPIVRIEKKCPCKGLYEYDCRNSFCAVNKDSCEIIFNNDNIFKEIAKVINDCK